jgi:hypothetical protein
MIFEVFETLARRGADSIVAGGCSYFSLTASTVFSSSGLGFVSFEDAFVASSLTCLTPAKTFTRPLIRSTADASWVFSWRNAFMPARISLRSASLELSEDIV